MSGATDPSSAAFAGDPQLDGALVEAFLDHVPDLVYFKDCESRFIAVSRSKAHRHGLQPEEMVGKCDADFFSEQHAQWARADEESIISTGEPVIGKTEKIVWPDGRVTWALSSKLPLRDESGGIIGTFGITEDITKEQQVKQDLEKTQRELLETSRTAGMAEVATGVLHNVGNVLTSLNVSASVIATALHNSKADSLSKVSAMLDEHADNLGEFLTSDPKGRRVPEFIESLARHAIDERNGLLTELASLQEHIDHVKEIVTMQQAYATMVGVVEALEPAVLMEDSLRMNAGALIRHEVGVMREFHPVPRVRAEKGKVLQILVNLIRNAKYASDEGGASDKIITLRIELGENRTVKFIVSDNGIGIAPENLPRMFTHGFTTRAEGHGFGLHSSATAAHDMQGTLSVFSEGLGKGATFTLELPAADEPPESDTTPPIPLR